MEIDKDKFLGLLLLLFRNLERIEKELLAHQATFITLKASGAFSDLDQVLELARKNAAPVLDKKHQEIRETIRKILDQANADQDLLRLIRQWTPTDPIH